MIAASSKATTSGWVAMPAASRSSSGLSRRASKCCSRRQGLQGRARVDRSRGAPTERDAGQNALDVADFGEAFGQVFEFAGYPAGWPPRGGAGAPAAGRAAGDASSASARGDPSRVLQRSTMPSRLFCGACGLVERISSRLRRLLASISRSLTLSRRGGCRWVASVFSVSRTYCSRQPAALMAARRRRYRNPAGRGFCTVRTAGASRCRASKYQGGMACSLRAGTRVQRR